MALQYKKVEEGNGIEIDSDGNPMVFDDEKEDEKPFGLNAIHLFTKIPELQIEAKTYREAKEKAEASLTSFGELKADEVAEKLSRLELFGDLDPAKAKEALVLVADLKDVDKENAIKIERVKEGVVESYEAKIRGIDTSWGGKVSALQDTLNRKEVAIRNLLIKGAFDRSVFIKERTVLPPDIAYDTFGKFFSVEEGESGSINVFALDSKGEKIFSKAKPGDYAEPEEAIELIINAYSQKNSILRTSQGGAGSSGNAGLSGTKRARQEELAKLPAGARLKELRKV